MTGTNHSDFWRPLRQKIRRARLTLIRTLYEHTVLVLTVFLCLGIAAVLWHLYVLGQTREGLRDSFALMAIMSILGMSSLALVIGRLRRISIELEQRVQERTAALKTSNDALEGEVAERKRAEESLRKVQEELETRVRQRTADLAKTNEELQGEIQERINAEEELAQAHALLRGLLDSIPDLIFYKNRSGHYLGCNIAFEEYAGKKERDLIDRTALDLFAADVGSIYQAQDAQVLSEGKPIRFEEWFDYRDGRRVLVETLKTPFFAPNGRVLGLIGISRDITERRRMEEQLRQAGKMEAIGKLAGGVAHDFNNLLTVILGNVSLILASAPPAAADRELLEAIDQAANRAAELTRQLLGFARQTPLRLEPIGVEQPVQETARILRRTIDPRITIEIEMPATPWTVKADAGQISQVLMNMCLNARDAMPEGGTLTLRTENVVLDEAHATTELEARAGEFVRISVGDTGHGIPEEIRAHIFDPFFTTKERGKGTGLGLAMVFGVIKQHQGWIECHSEVEKGTRFDIYLPRCQRSAEQPAVSETAPAAAVGHETILVVDDEAMIRDLGRAILHNHGYDVLLAADGHEAVEIYQREHGHIDLVILDLTMPRLSGRDTLHWLRQINPGVRVLFSSGYANDHVDDAHEAGVYGHLHKPYRRQELVNAVRGALVGS